MMNRLDVIECATEQMRSYNYMFNKCVNCEALDNEWADFAVDTGILKDRPDKTMGSSFRLDPPSEDTADNRG